MNHKNVTSMSKPLMLCAAFLFINSLWCFAVSPKEDGDSFISLPDEPVKNAARENTSGTASTSRKIQNATKTKESSLGKQTVSPSEGIQYEDSLQAVLYDLKRMRDGRANIEFAEDSGNGTYREDFLPPLMKILQPFVNGSWQKTYDSKSGVAYTELNKYYRPSARVRASVFYMDESRSEQAPGLLVLRRFVKK